MAQAEGPLLATTNARTTSNLDLLRSEFMASRFVERLQARKFIVGLGTMERLPRSQGKVVQWDLLANLAVATTALAEGADPTNSAAVTTTQLQATIQKFGDFIELTEELELMAVSHMMQELIDILADQAKDTLEVLVLGVGLAAGPTAGLAATTNLNDAGTAMGADDIKLAAQELASQNAKPHRMSPGGEFYIGLLSPEAAYDMAGEGSPTWTQAKAQAFNESLTTPFDATMANSAIYNVIVKQTTNIQRATDPSPDDDHNFVIADNSFGVTALESNLSSPEIKEVQAGVASLASPLGSRGTLGWRLLFANVLFDSNRVVEITSDATGIGV